MRAWPRGIRGVSLALLRSAALFGVLLAQLAPAAAGPESVAIAPLASDKAAALRAVPSDPAPAKLVNDWHFVVSNENHPDRFRSAVAGLGGMYIGVGAEPGYLFAGWARSELVVMMDFDGVIADVHAMYQALLLTAPDPDTLLDMWAPRNEARARSVILQHVGEARWAGLKRYHHFASKMIHARLRFLKSRMEHRQIPTFLTSQAEYDHIVAMVRAGRVHALRGDLTGEHTMRALGTLARDLGLSVRVLYTSNAEEYFHYSRALKDNVRGLPIDDRAVLLRTSYVARGDDGFAYVVQPTKDFVAWLDVPGVYTVRQILSGQQYHHDEKVALHVNTPPPRAALR